LASVDAERTLIQTGSTCPQSTPTSHDPPSSAKKRTEGLVEVPSPRCVGEGADAGGQPRRPDRGAVHAEALRIEVLPHHLLEVLGGELLDGVVEHEEHLLIPEGSKTRSQLAEVDLRRTGTHGHRPRAHRR
jgi:hypothetical protein